MIVGVTGCPGSGKSTLSGMLRDRGWSLIDADAIGREVVETSSVVLNELLQEFGPDILDNAGILDRRLLARRAFADKSSTHVLNDIVHPRLIESLKERIDRQVSKHEAIVVDCALIHEWDIASFFDTVVCVAADYEIRKRRLIKRDRRSPSDIDDLCNAQLPEINKMRLSDMSVMNNAETLNLERFSYMLTVLPEMKK